MGRLPLNVLLSFAQFEREVTGERIHDEIAAPEHLRDFGRLVEPDQVVFRHYLDKDRVLPAARL